MSKESSATGSVSAFSTVQDEKYAPLLVAKLLDLGQTFTVHPVCNGGKCEYIITAHVQHRADLTNYLGIKWDTASARSEIPAKPQCVYRTGCETPNDCREHGYCRSPKNAAPQASVAGASVDSSRPVSPATETPMPAAAAPTETALKRCEECDQSFRCWDNRLEQCRREPETYCDTPPSATRDSTPLDKLAALMVKNDGMDVDICSPGNHGGRGKDANRWLVTLTPADSSNIREFFGDTLEEVINYAAR